jgi:hypothetical protein
MLRKYGLFFSAVLLAVLLVGLQSFKEKKKEFKKSTTDKWYTFDLGSTHTGENDATNYSYLEGQDPETVTCDGEQYVCVILAPEGANSEPDLPGMSNVFTDSRIQQIVLKN